LLSGIDIIPFIVTLITSLLFGLEYGILVGVAVSLCFELYKTSRPDLAYHVVEVTPKSSNTPYHVLVATPNQSLNFSSAEFFRYKVLKHAQSDPAITHVVVDGSHIHSIDTTVVKNIRTMVDDIKLQNQQIFLLNWHRDVVTTLLRSSRDYEQHLCTNPSVDDLLKMLRESSS
jgi:solute carrier family 26 (sodium-independent sulfate anion transporter), member 11